MPSQGIYFTEPFFGKESLNGKKLTNFISSASARFIVKIDDRGRIYVPAGLRISNSFSFKTDFMKRRFLLFSNGSYSIDSKGRVSVPADIRRSLGINSGSMIALAGCKGVCPTKPLSRIAASGAERR